MKYAKPEVSLLSAATAAIQGSPGSKVGITADSQTPFNPMKHVTNNAYEADE